jgi:Uncharacterized protein conserved in bacteria
MKKIYFHADDYGRSIEISKNIFKCLIKGHLNSVSIMVSYLPATYHYKLKKLKKINKRLHLNLTELPTRDQSNFIYNLSFLRLIFLGNREKKIIYKEIEKQIKKYINLYNPKIIKLDGHEHVHMIPWIFKYILKIKTKYNIQEIRIPNEIIYFPRIKDLLSPRYFRNLAACLIIKLFNFFLNTSKYRKSYFFGIIYSGLQTENTIRNSVNNLINKDDKNIEILIHPGFTGFKEKKNV